MTRPFRHAAVKPFRVTHSAVTAHRGHGPTPFLGCAVCARRAMRGSSSPRWTSARLG
jgi:hypothetical protein